MTTSMLAAPDNPAARLRAESNTVVCCSWPPYRFVSHAGDDRFSTRDYGTVRRALLLAGEPGCASSRQTPRSCNWLRPVGRRTRLSSNMSPSTASGFSACLEEHDSRCSLLPYLTFLFSARLGFCSILRVVGGSCYQKLPVPYFRRFPKTWTTNHLRLEGSVSARK